MANWYDGPPLLLVFWAQPADTLSPDYYNFQGKDLDPSADARTRARIAKAVARLTALKPGPRTKVGRDCSLMRWRDPSGVPKRLYRALAEVRTAPATDSPAPTAITVYTAFEVLSAAASAGSQISLLLPGFASRTAQVVHPETLERLAEAIQDQREYGSGVRTTWPRVTRGRGRPPHVHDLRALEPSAASVDATPAGEGIGLEEGDANV